MSPKLWSIGEIRTNLPLTRVELSATKDIKKAVE